MTDLCVRWHVMVVQKHLWKTGLLQTFDIPTDSCLVFSPVNMKSWTTLPIMQREIKQLVHSTENKQTVFWRLVISLMAKYDFLPPGLKINWKNEVFRNLFVLLEIKITGREWMYIWWSTHFLLRVHRKLMTDTNKHLRRRNVCLSLNILSVLPFPSLRHRDVRVK